MMLLSPSKQRLIFLWTLLIFQNCKKVLLFPMTGQKRTQQIYTFWFVWLILLPYNFLTSHYANDSVQNTFVVIWDKISWFEDIFNSWAFLTGNKCGHASMQIEISENVWLIICLLKHVCITIKYAWNQTPKRCVHFMFFYFSVFCLFAKENPWLCYLIFVKHT